MSRCAAFSHYTCANERATTAFHRRPALFDIQTRSPLNSSAARRRPRVVEFLYTPAVSPLPPSLLSPADFVYLLRVLVLRFRCDDSAEEILIFARMNFRSGERAEKLL